MRSGIIVLVLFVGLAAARANEREQAEKYDKKIRAELEALEPKALADWDAANAARSANEADKAAQAYGRVLELAPRFSHAHRRLCGELTQLNKLDRAIASCRKALELAELPENGSALAFALSKARGGQASSSAGEVDGLVDRWLRPGVDIPALEALCQAAANVASPHFAQCAQALLRADPNGMAANYFGTIEAAEHGDWGSARARLEKAHTVGLPDDAYRLTLGLIDKTEPHTTVYLTWIGVALVAWFVVFGLILVAGYILSHKALAAASRPPSDLRENAAPGEHRLRRLYAAVLTATIVFFYLSIPILLLAVIVVFGGIIYIIIQAGHIPVKLVLICAVVGGGTVIAVVKSLFARRRDDDPGTLLPLAAHPGLGAALSEVAARIGTRTVDSVYLTPGTDLAVMERKKKCERCLILGVAVLDGMALVDFKSILGHEHGHFKNADTAGGGMALAVRRSLLHMARGMARGGAATWYNPAWWFVRGFWAAFLRVSQGATRLQEVLADRWAAVAYGSAAFARGMRHIVARSVAFDWHANATVREAVEEKLPVPNFYRHAPKQSDDDKKKLDVGVADVLGRAASDYDSHPPPSSRIAWVEALAIAEPPDAGEGMAWDLFADREALERLMTAKIRDNVQRHHGVTFAS